MKEQIYKSAKTFGQLKNMLSAYCSDVISFTDIGNGYALWMDDRKNSHILHLDRKGWKELACVNKLEKHILFNNGDLAFKGQSPYWTLYRKVHEVPEIFTDRIYATSIISHDNGDLEWKRCNEHNYYKKAGAFTFIDKKSGFTYTVGTPSLFQSGARFFRKGAAAVKALLSLKRCKDI